MYSELRSAFVARGLQLLLLSCGILLLAWAFFDPRLRDSEGFMNRAFCLQVSIGTALIILGSAVTGRFKKFAFWLALALVGHAASLQLIDAGPLIRYQHYKPLARIVGESHPLVLGVLVGQTIFVAMGMRRLWPDLQAWIRSSFKVWQLVGVGLVFVLPSAAVSREISFYLKELPLAVFVQGLSLANIILVAAAFPADAGHAFRRRFDRFVGQLQDGVRPRPPRLDRFALLGAIWVAVLAASLSFFLYQRHPHVPDEVVYLYQARYLAQGQLTTPAPPVPDAFSIYMIPHQSDRWYSPFPPGWPAVLATGILLNLPWLINPVLAGINVLLSYLLLGELYCRRTARVAVLLLSTSPWHVFMAMNFMSHTLTLTCSLVAALAMARAKRTGKVGLGLLSGLAVGALSLIRPLDCLVVGGLVGLWAVGLGGPRLKVLAIVAFVVGAMSVSSASLAYNKIVAGDATLSPLMGYYEKYYGPRTNALGFGPERGLGWAMDAFPGHSPQEALINANLNAFSVNIELLGWGTGSLLIAAFVLIFGARLRSDYLMLSVIAAVFLLYSLYWFSGGPDFGARYWYLMIVPLVALAARGIECFEKRLDAAASRAAATVAVVALCFFSLVNYFPWRAIDKYHNYLRMRPDIRHLAEEYAFGKSVVLIRGQSHPDYQSAWTYNPLDLEAEAPVYAWDRDPETRARVLRAYEDRPVWVVDGPTITHGPYRVVAGPLSAPELLARLHEPPR
jgi:hypothetical protein